MKAFVQFIMLAVVSLTIAACAKTPEKKAQDQAQNLTKEQNALANSLTSAGTPSASWSTTELNDYEAKLNRLEAVEAALAGHNGKNGVYVFNGDNSRFIRYNRSKLEDARAEKSRAS